MVKFKFSPQLTAKNLFWFPLFLIIYSFTGNVSNDIYMPSMPALTSFFTTDESWIQLTLTLWFLGTAVPQLLLGPVADRFGRRPLLFVGGLVFLLSTLICALSRYILILTIARFFQGVGVCTLTIVSFAVIRELYQDQQCIRLLSLVNMCNSIAPLAGPLIGGYIFILLGWQANFYLVLVIALIGLIGLWYFMPESKTNLDINALKPKELISNYAMLIKNKSFLRDLLMYGLLFGGMIAYLTGAPFILIDQLKMEPQHFGYSQLAVFSMFILGASLVGRLTDRFGSRKIIIVGILIIMVASFSMLLTSILLPKNLYGFVVSMIGYGFGFGLVSGPLAKEALSATKQAGGFAAAMLGFSMTGFASIGSFIVSLSYNGTIFLVALVILMMVTLAFIVAGLAICRYGFGRAT